MAYGRRGHHLAFLANYSSLVFFFCLIDFQDLKFENVLFETKDPDSPIKLIDFGFSMKYGDGQLMSQSVGTIYSMAPEVLCGKTYTNACDAWSIGVIAYMLLSENFAIPFDGEDDVEIAKNILECHLDFPGTHWSNVSEEAKDFIRHCLAKYPHHRASIQNCLESDWLTGAKPQPVAEDVKRKLLGNAYSVYATWHRFHFQELALTKTN